MFKHILLPTDGSQLSQDAVRRAVMFAQAAGARITAFYAMHEPEPPYFVEGREIDTTIWNRSGQSSELEASRILAFPAPTGRRRATRRTRPSSKQRKKMDAT
jgi:nucleotide-binding universal stress UspA family protein